MIIARKHGNKRQKNRKIVFCLKNVIKYNKNEQEVCILSKKKKKDKKNARLHYANNNVNDFPVNKMMRQDDKKLHEHVSDCPYYRKRFCILRDDICKPGSLKCKRNKTVFRNNTFSYVQEPAVKRNGTNRYNQYDFERYGTNTKILDLKLNEERLELNVFRGFLNLKKGETKDYYLYVEDILTGKKYRIVVAYNTYNYNYYISDTQLKWLHKHGIYPKAEFYRCNDGSVSFSELDFQEFSELKLYGYAAGKSGLDVEKRHKLLQYIIDNNFMHRYEIIEHLQGLIALRLDRTDKDYSTAIGNWRADIMFVNEYKN